MQSMTKNPNIELSINPTYACNLNCDFCYLKHSPEILDLAVLEDKLNDISTKWTITVIELYGGELCLLDDLYLLKLLMLCKKYTTNISVTTNFTIDKPWLFSRKDIQLNVSWDYKYRPNGDIVFEKLKQFNNIGIIMTAQGLYKDRYEVVNLLNTLTNNYSIDVKVCMPSFYNNIESTQLKDFQVFSLFLIANLNKNFNLIHLNTIYGLNNHSRAHAFISPSGALQTLKTRDGKEYFEDCQSILDVDISTPCLECPYQARCLVEHNVEVNDKYDCLGHKHLVETINLLSNYKVYSWRKRRTLSYILNTNTFGDEHLPYFEMPDSDIEKIIVRFFETTSDLLYPAKSYYVAIIYAWLLNKYFGEDIKVALGYPDLLNYDDTHFSPYGPTNKEVYDNLIAKIIPGLNEGKYTASIASTVSYFNKEFLIDENRLHKTN